MKAESLPTIQEHALPVATTLVTGDFIRKVKADHTSEDLPYATFEAIVQGVASASGTAAGTISGAVAGSISGASAAEGVLDPLVAEATRQAGIATTQAGLANTAKDYSAGYAEDSDLSAQAAKVSETNSKQSETNAAASLLAIQNSLTLEGGFYFINL